MGTFFNAQRNILRMNISARTKLNAPPNSYRRAVLRHPKITLPYNNVETAIACTNYMRTLLLCNPSNLVWHLMLLNAPFAFYNLFSNIVLGLLFFLSITNPKYLNSDTYSISILLLQKFTSILICIAFVFLTFICNPFSLQNFSKAFNSSYKPSALWDNRTASSAKARKKIYIVAISNRYRL